MTQSLPVPRLSAVVCTYDRYQLLPDAIDSLLRQELEAGAIEIIVVDNSPDQKQAARFGQRFADTLSVRYLLEATPGLSRARNVATAHARAPLVAFIDDDAIAAPDWAEHMLRTFDAYAGRAGAVGGRVLPRWTAPRPPWLPDSDLGYLSILDWGEETRPIHPREWLVGCNIAFDKEALASVGGFSGGLGRTGAGLSLLSSEEIDVIERMRHAGRLPIYCPDALVHHVIDPARLTRTWFRRRSAWQAVSEFIKDPERMAAYVPAAVAHLKSEIHDRSGGPAAGFFRATDDAQEFKHEAALAYDLVVSLLAGGAELDGRGQLAERIPVSARLRGRVRAVAQASPAFRRVLFAALRVAPRAALVRKRAGL
jgi:GT2 family glycosyltransferase